MVFEAILNCKMDKVKNLGTKLQDSTFFSPHFCSSKEVRENCASSLILHGSMEKVIFCFLLNIAPEIWPSESGAIPGLVICSIRSHTKHNSLPSNRACPVPRHYVLFAPIYVIYLYYLRALLKQEREAREKRSRSMRCDPHMSRMSKQGSCHAPDIIEHCFNGKKVY